VKEFHIWHGLCHPLGQAALSSHDRVGCPLGQGGLSGAERGRHPSGTDCVTPDLTTWHDLCHMLTSIVTVSTLAP